MSLAIHAPGSFLGVRLWPCDLLALIAMPFRVDGRHKKATRGGGLGVELIIDWIRGRVCPELRYRPHLQWQLQLRQK